MIRSEGFSWGEGEGGVAHKNSNGYRKTFKKCKNILNHENTELLKTHGMEG